MSTKKLFVFEFITGGGLNQESIPSSLFCEGYGMLRTIIQDFKQLKFEIITLLDERIALFSEWLEADRITFISAADNYVQKFTELVQQSKYCFIIAPEFSNILYDLTKIVKANFKNLLSIDLEGITLGTSKIRTYEYLKTSGLHAPITYLIPKDKNDFNTDFIYKKFTEISRPIVIKPNDGVGAEAIYYFETESELTSFLEHSFDALDSQRDYILQEFINGEDLSVSLIGTSSIPLILSINSQKISLNKNRTAEYMGGATPIKNHDQIIVKIQEVLEKLDLSMFKGYFGVDFILRTDGTIFIIDINPRLTTSYLGIRNILTINPAQLIYQAQTEGIENIPLIPSYHSQFLRLELDFKGETKQQGDISNEMIRQIPEMITPLISLGKSTHYSCLLATKTDNPDASSNRIVDIIKKLSENGLYVSKSN
ncbi:MAG: ATP-grasp domain-containing protein [Promethearchaeota archaeon]|nr:MAG: ATP-grasp domain-containing protein [Candidatus Lokiarchaeota archaeon]